MFGFSKTSGIALAGSTFVAVQLHRARPIFDLRNVDHGQLQRRAHLLGREADAIRRMHRLQHVGREGANALVHFLDPLALARAESGRRILRSAISFLAVREGGQIFHARELQRVHHFDDRAERSLLVRLQGERRLARRRQIPHGRFQLFRGDHLAIEPDFVVLVYAHDGVLELSRRVGRRLRFGKVDLNFRLILFERGRDDEKDEENRQDIDERDDDDGRRPPFPDCNFHGNDNAGGRVHPTGARAGAGDVVLGGSTASPLGTRP